MSIHMFVDIVDIHIYFTNVGEYRYMNEIIDK